MKFESKFNIGDKVFPAYGSDIILYPITIGKIKVEHTDSPGREGEELFDNYKRQNDYKEEYMCVETGIGSGSVYNGERLFKNREGAVEKLIEITKLQSDN